MRVLVATALSLLALPAVAQDRPEPRERRIVIEIDSTFFPGPAHRLDLDAEDGPGPGALFHRFFDGLDREGEVFRLRVPDLDERPGVWFGAEGTPLLRGFGLQPGVSPETRERLDEAEEAARDLARRARQAEGAERRALEADLTDALGEVFELRAEVRREQAAHLRERAAELAAEADEMEAALRARAARRAALIEARRAELLGDRASDW